MHCTKILLGGELRNQTGIDESAASQLVDYLATGRAAFGTLPTRERLVLERFFDEAGDTHLVVHSPLGSRINRAFGLSLRKCFCRRFNFELQAAALEDTIVLSLGAVHSFALEDVPRFLSSKSIERLLEQAVLGAPLFPTRFRWNASIALAIRRFRNGRKQPAQLQRMDRTIFSVVPWEQRARYLRLLIEGATDAAKGKTIIEIFEGTTKRTELDAIFTRLRAWGLERKVFNDLGPGPAFELLRVLGRHAGSGTLDVWYFVALAAELVGDGLGDPESAARGVRTAIARRHGDRLAQVAVRVLANELVQRGLAEATEEHRLMLAHDLDADEVAARVERDQQVDRRALEAWNRREIDRLEHPADRPVVRRERAADRPHRDVFRLVADEERRREATFEIGACQFAGDRRRREGHADEYAERDGKPDQQRAVDAVLEGGDERQQQRQSERKPLPGADRGVAEAEAGEQEQQVWDDVQERGSQDSNLGPSVLETDATTS